jgi:hypothetical protein
MCASNPRQHNSLSRARLPRTLAIHDNTILRRAPKTLIHFSQFPHNQHSSCPHSPQGRAHLPCFWGPGGGGTEHALTGITNWPDTWGAAGGRLRRGSRSTGRKLTPVSLHLPQISHELDRVQSQVAAVRCWRLSS